MISCDQKTISNETKNRIISLRLKAQQQNRKLAEILFDFCEECTKMAAIPHGAFAACKLRSYTEKNMTLSIIQTTEKQESKNFPNMEAMEYSPVKYNSKLMNSIWGLYNRYSPHNIKSNDDELNAGAVFLQQPLAVAGYVLVHNMVKTIKSGNEWIFPEKSLVKGA